MGETTAADMITPLCTVVLRYRIHLEQRGYAPARIQFLLGHVSIQTTERYLGCKQS